MLAAATFPIAIGRDPAALAGAFDAYLLGVAPF
jgi:hypothetical protein